MVTYRNMGQERRDQYLWDSWRALHGHFFWSNLAWVGFVHGMKQVAQAPTSYPEARWDVLDRVADLLCGGDGYL